MEDLLKEPWIALPVSSGINARLWLAAVAPEKEVEALAVEYIRKNKKKDDEFRVSEIESQYIDSRFEWADRMIRQSKKESE